MTTSTEPEASVGALAVDSRVLLLFYAAPKQKPLEYDPLGDKPAVSSTTTRRLVEFQSSSVRSADHVDRERCK